MGCSIWRRGRSRCWRGRCRRRTARRSGRWDDQVPSERSPDGVHFNPDHSGLVLSMGAAARERIRRIWAQPSVPVLLRRGKGKRPRLRLPFAPKKRDNRSWIRHGRRTDIRWDAGKKYWEVPQAWFNDLVDRCLEEFGKIYIIQPYREQEKCAPACWNATGHECQCSCMGEHHGTGGPEEGWNVVSDTFATRWGNESYACRLLTK